MDDPEINQIQAG